MGAGSLTATATGRTTGADAGVVDAGIEMGTDAVASAGTDGIGAGRDAGMVGAGTTFAVRWPAGEKG